MYIILAHKSIILTTHALSLSLKFASAGSMCKRRSRGGGGGGPHPPPPGKLQMAIGFLRSFGTDTPREEILV